MFLSILLCLCSTNHLLCLQIIEHLEILCCNKTRPGSLEHLQASLVFIHMDNMTCFLRKYPNNKTINNWASARHIQHLSEFVKLWVKLMALQMASWSWVAPGSGPNFLCVSFLKKVSKILKLIRLGQFLQHLQFLSSC